MTIVKGEIPKENNSRLEGFKLLIHSKTKYII